MEEKICHICGKTEWIGAVQKCDKRHCEVAVTEYPACWVKCCEQMEAMPKKKNKYRVVKLNHTILTKYPSHYSDQFIKCLTTEQVQAQYPGKKVDCIKIERNPSSQFLTYRIREVI